jgi:hypothetical protein
MLSEVAAQGAQIESLARRHGLYPPVPDSPSADPHAFDSPSLLIDTQMTGDITGPQWDGQTTPRAAPGEPRAFANASVSNIDALPMRSSQVMGTALATEATADSSGGIWNPDLSAPGSSQTRTSPDDPAARSAAQETMSGLEERNRARLAALRAAQAAGSGL